ncbi:MAG TPA: phosphatidate cytidylyltransferase [Acidimicrobiales bacterium]
MSDWDERHEKPQRDPTEGVRIIGADEAAEALERGDVRRRLSEDEPRFGDRPPQPPVDGPRPALRFPLTNDDPASFERPATQPVQPRTQAPELSHWAGSAAEEVPNMSRRDPRDPDDGAWSPYGEPEPRWRDDEPVEPATRTWAPPEPGPVGYDDPVDAPAGRSVFADVPDDPGAYDDYDDDPYGAPAGDGYGAAYDDGVAVPPPPPPGPVPGPGRGVDPEVDPYDDEYGYDDEYYEADPGYADVPGDPGGPPVAGDVRQSARARRRAGGRGSDRDMRSAVGVGVLFAAVALALFAFAGPLGGMVVAVPVITYASYEFFVAVHRAGFQPLLPVGVAATAASVIVAYNYGEQAIPLVLVLTAAVCFLWYLVNAGGDRPAANIGVTLLGVVWIGVFGSFAGLLLSVPTHGVAFLLAAVIPTVAYDIGGLFVGRSAGSRALSSASPNKTIEGLAGGMFLAVVAGVVFAMVEVTPFAGMGDGLKVGLVAALAAPIGDLAESLIKRDLDVKDMGSILPGHGGLLDRFDAMLFVLPAIWYLSRLSDFFLT